MKTQTKAVTRTEIPVKEIFIFALVTSIIFGAIELGYYVGLIREFNW